MKGGGCFPTRQYVNKPVNCIENLPTRVRHVTCEKPQCPPYGVTPPCGMPPCGMPPCGMPPCGMPPCGMPPCMPPCGMPMPPCGPCGMPPPFGCMPFPPCPFPCPPCFFPCPPPCYYPPPCMPPPPPAPCMPCVPPPCGPPCPPKPCIPPNPCAPGPKPCCGGPRTLMCVPRGCPPTRGGGCCFPKPTMECCEKPASYNNCNFYVTEAPPVKQECPPEPQPQKINPVDTTTVGCGDDEFEISVDVDTGDGQIYHGSSNGAGQQQQYRLMPRDKLETIVNVSAGDDKIYPAPAGYPGSNRQKWGGLQDNCQPGETCGTVPVTVAPAIMNRIRTKAQIAAPRARPQQNNPASSTITKSKSNVTVTVTKQDTAAPVSIMKSNENSCTASRPSCIPVPIRKAVTSTRATAGNSSRPTSRASSRQESARSMSSHRSSSLHQAARNVSNQRSSSRHQTAVNVSSKRSVSRHQVEERNVPSHALSSKLPESSESKPKVTVRVQSKSRTPSRVRVSVRATENTSPAPSPPPPAPRTVSPCPQPQTCTPQPRKHQKCLPRKCAPQKACPTRRNEACAPAADATCRDGRVIATRAPNPEAVCSPAPTFPKNPAISPAHNCNYDTSVQACGIVNPKQHFGGGPQIGGGIRGYAGGPGKGCQRAAHYCPVEDGGCPPPRVLKYKRKNKCCIPKKARRLKTLCEKCHDRYMVNNCQAGLPMPSAPPRRGRAATRIRHPRAPQVCQQQSQAFLPSQPSPQPRPRSRVTVNVNVNPGGGYRAEPSETMRVAGDQQAYYQPQEVSDSQMSLADNEYETTDDDNYYTDDDSDGSLTQLYKNSRPAPVSSRTVNVGVSSSHAITSRVNTSVSAPHIGGGKVSVSVRSSQHQQPEEQPRYQCQEVRETRSLSHCRRKKRERKQNCCPATRKPFFSLLPPLCPARETKASILRKVIPCKVQRDICAMPVFVDGVEIPVEFCGQPSCPLACPPPCPPPCPPLTRVLEPSRTELSRIIIRKEPGEKQRNITVFKKHIPRRETFCPDPCGFPCPMPCPPPCPPQPCPRTPNCPPICYTDPPPGGVCYTVGGRSCPGNDRCPQDDQITVQQFPPCTPCGQTCTYITTKKACTPPSPPPPPPQEVKVNVTVSKAKVNTASSACNFPDPTYSTTTRTKVQLRDGSPSFGGGNSFRDPDAMSIGGNSFQYRDQDAISMGRGNNFQDDEMYPRTTRMVSVRDQQSRMGGRAQQSTTRYVATNQVTSTTGLVLDVDVHVKEEEAPPPPQRCDPCPPQCDPCPPVCEPRRRKKRDRCLQECPPPCLPICLPLCPPPCPPPCIPECPPPCPPPCIPDCPPPCPKPKKCLPMCDPCPPPCPPPCPKPKKCQPVICDPCPPPCPPPCPKPKKCPPVCEYRPPPCPPPCPAKPRKCLLECEPCPRVRQRRSPPCEPPPCPQVCVPCPSPCPRPPSCPPEPWVYFNPYSCQTKPTTPTCKRKKKKACKKKCKTYQYPYCTPAEQLPYCIPPEPQQYCPAPEPEPEYYCPPYQYRTNKPQSDNPKDYYRSTTYDNEYDDEDWGNSADDDCAPAPSPQKPPKMEVQVHTETKASRKGQREDDWGYSPYDDCSPPPSQRKPPKMIEIRTDSPKPFRKGQHDDIYEDENAAIRIYVNRDYNPDASKYQYGGTSSRKPFNASESENWDQPKACASPRPKIVVKQQYTQAPSVAPVDKQPSTTPTIYCEDPSGSTVLYDPSEKTVSPGPSLSYQRSPARIQTDSPSLYQLPVQQNSKDEEGRQPSIRSRSENPDEGRQPSVREPADNPASRSVGFQDPDIIPPPEDFAQQTSRVYKHHHHRSGKRKFEDRS